MKTSNFWEFHLRCIPSVSHLCHWIENCDWRFGWRCFCGSTSVVVLEKAPGVRRPPRVGHAYERILNPRHGRSIFVEYKSTAMRKVEDSRFLPESISSWVIRYRENRRLTFLTLSPSSVSIAYVLSERFYNVDHALNAYSEILRTSSYGNGDRTL